MAAATARRGLRRDQESLITRRIVVTTGEPAGVGPDLALAAALVDWPCELVFTGDPDLLAVRAERLRIALRPSTWREDSQSAPHRAGTLPVLASKLGREALPGRPDPANARYVLAMIDAAAEGCLAGRFDAMVTAPVQKSSINDAGIPFQGHTEYLAAKCGDAHPVMLLVAGTLRIALATRTCRSRMCPGTSRARCSGARSSCSTRACAARLASKLRASSFAGSTRTPAKADILAAKKSKSSP